MTPGMTSGPWQPGRPRPAQHASLDIHPGPGRLRDRRGDGLTATRPGWRLGLVCCAFGWSVTVPSTTGAWSPAAVGRPGGLARCRAARAAPSSLWNDPSLGLCARWVVHATTDEETAMSATDELLRNNDAYAGSFASGDLPMPPGKQVAVLACMDARLNVYGVLGLHEGDAHVIRNAGGVVTDDAIRSLVISQRLLGTREIVLIHHIGCGMVTFPDAEQDVRQSIARIKASPFIPHTDQVRGFVYDVATGRLNEVTSIDASR